jgi:hypothetical protein
MANAEHRRESWMVARFPLLHELSHGVHHQQAGLPLRFAPAR